MSPQALDPSHDGLIPGYDQSDEFSPFRAHLRTIRLRKTEVTITLEHLAEQWKAQEGCCALTGWDLDNSPRHCNENPNAPHRASVDRIDCCRGYVPGNVRWLSAMANYAKHRWNDREVRELAAAVVSHQGSISPLTSGLSSHYIGLSPFREHRRRLARRQTCSVTIEELVSLWDQQSGVCSLTGWVLELSPERERLNPWGPRKASVDRIDSKDGYVIDNIRWVANMANCAKHQWSDATLLGFSEAVVASDLR